MKVFEANLEHQYIHLDVDIMKIFEKKFVKGTIKFYKYKFDFLNGRKLGED